MPQSRPWTDTDTGRLRELHAQGLTLHAIAKEMGRAKATVSKYAERAGLTWDRTQVANATEARTIDAKARRAELKANLLADATRLREQLFAPTIVFNFGGKDNTYEERTLDQPPHADQLKIMQATSTALASYERLEKLDADTGLTDAVGMLDKVFEGIRAAAREL